MTEDFIWASDVAISTPEPCEHPDGISVPFGGLGFTPNGMAFDLTEVDREQFYTSVYKPTDDSPHG